MFTCKQVSKTLLKDDYNHLSAIRKCMLKLHVTLCFVCGKFNRQIMSLQDMCRNYKNKEHILEPSCCKLDEEKKKNLKQVLNDQNKSKSEK